MTKEDKLSSLKETERDINREIVRIREKMDKNLDNMTNPAESQKQFNSIIEELEIRKIIIAEITKDVNDLYQLRRIIKDN